MSQSDYRGIDLVVVNLYPFQQTVAKPDSDDALIIENIDIGGPSMIRSAAKNHASVTVVVEPADYEPMLKQLREHDCTTDLQFRRECAKKAFSLTAEYDMAISEYFILGKDFDSSECPEGLSLSLEKKSSLRYGENPHQEASIYKLQGFSGPTLLNSKQLSGKELSYNNYNDLDACLGMLLDFSEPFACVLKHANPCGAAVGDTVAKAYKKAYDSDPLSAFGSIIGLNKEVDMSAAELLHDTPFVECILAPSFSNDAFKLLKRKKTRRLLTLDSIVKGRSDGELIYKYIRGGFLVQSADDKVTLPADLKVVTKRQPTEDEIKEMLFGWKIVKHTKSNA
ncbi:MAG TPA: bifunctional phosphoribosylaminoimidazolecarboxamide formyltransferase/IMP cyclohydrolase, partial [candidate division Zixibacteria bacterium]|nr:bifunctional phosphoribosylaminoimidazolecarboxamide formyltransferase/IMP cyclohydrolase [candidate division Zixibacteria bacterium]